MLDSCLAVRPVRTLAAVLSLSIVALASSGAANAASFDYSDVASATLAFKPGHFVFDGTGAWVAGNATARYNADGSLAFVVPVESASGDAMLAETIDGGVVEAAQPYFGSPNVVPCSATKVGPGGTQQWSALIDPGAVCASISGDGSGTLWIATIPTAPPNVLGVYRIDADGSDYAKAALPSAFFGLAMIAAPSAGSYVAGFGSQSTHGEVVAVDGGGAVRWDWSGSSSDVVFTNIGLDAAGNVYAMGLAADHTLVAASLDSAGQVRWEQHLAAPAPDQASGFAVAADGSSFALVPSSDGTHRVLEKIATDGTLAWQSDLPLQNVGAYPSAIDGHAGLRLAPNGDILALADSGLASMTTTTDLFRFDANGALLATSTLTGQPGASVVDVSQMQALSDSSAFLTTRSDFNSDTLGSLGSAASSGVYLHFDVAGHVQPSPLAAGSVPTVDIVADATVADDGTTYLISNELLDVLADPSIGGFASHYALTAISPTGARLWRVDNPGFWSQAHVLAADGRVCIAGTLAQYWLIAYGTSTAPAGGIGDVRVDCYAVQSGAPSSTQTLHPGSAGFESVDAARLFDDGTLRVAYTPGIDPNGDNSGVQLTLVDLDASGVVAATHAITTTADAIGIFPNRSVLTVNVSNTDLALHLAAFGIDGTTVYDTALPTTDHFLAGQALDDGTAQLTLVDDGGTVALKSFSSSGALQWTAPLASGASTASLFGIASVSDETNTFVTLTFGGADATVTGAQVIAIDRASGAVVWNTPIPAPVSQALVVVDPDSGALTYLAINDSRIVTQQIDRASGSLGATTTRGCGHAQCTGLALAAPRISDDGTLHYTVANNLTNGTNGLNPHVVGIDAIDATPAQIPVAQAGIDGIWYAPYESGQGFGIDFIASNGTLFIPWFTYTQTGGNDPAALVWYSMQGNVSSDDTSAQLTIFANTGGAFNSGTTASHAVGSATLTFSDCDNGTLTYLFDADTNGGASGSISITRLTMAIASCTLANGAPSGPGGDIAPANGFSTSQGGAWYDPTTSGQGIELSVIPQSANSSGLLFGAWFTYDPAGAADDPTHQHWFTLQADLAGATAGTVTVPIYATLGGTFDGTPTTNTSPIGNAVFTFSGCSAATADYQFDDTSLAHAYRNASGTLHLSKLGGCTD